MKKNLFSRLAASAMALAMLLPCGLSASASNGETVELYRWVADTTSAGTNMSIEQFRSNVINETTSRSNGHFVNVTTGYDENGPYKLKIFSFRNSVNTQSSTKKHYGLPYETVSGKKKATETLRFELGGAPYPLSTEGLEALNVDFTYVDNVKANSAVLAYCRELRVYVSLDGETWLEDSAGVRSTKLLGGGMATSTRDGLIYEIQTENLFDIEGLEPGDTIMNIAVRPEGEFSRPFGTIGFADITVNGYTTKAAWEAAVPPEDWESITVDPAILRQIVVDEAVRTATLPWTTDTIVDLTSPVGSSATATTFSTRQFVPGFQYQGPVYARILDATREQLAAAIVDGKYMGGYGTDTALGMDCQTFGFNATSRVSRNYGWACQTIIGASGVTMLGDLVTSETMPQFTDADIIDLNTPEAVYEAYALADTGDVLDTYKNGGSGLHVRIVKDVFTVRNPDGSIDPDKSYMLCVESSSDMYYEVQNADGSVVSVEGEDPADLYAYLDTHPGAQVLYGHTADNDTKYTFSNLRDSDYVAFTLDEYADGVVAMPDVECVFSPMTVGTDFWQSGLHLAVASNYRIVGYTIKLEDRSTGKVLFEEFLTPQADPINVGFNYENAKLNDMMKNLSNGSYRLSVIVSSGPLTAIGQTEVPKSTKCVDFTITERESNANAYLFAPSAAAKGQNVEVFVRINTGFDAADVEIKYDPSALTYVSGQYTHVDGEGWVTGGDGILRIMAVDANLEGAGQLAKLIFSANSDMTNVPDTVQVKSAFITTAAAANDNNAEKATTGTQPCASVGMLDVGAGAWYHEAVDYVLDQGIMSGYNAGSFGPNDKLSRAMVVQVLFNKEGKPSASGGQTFPDVKNGDWFKNAVAWAAENKVVDGYGDGRFGPNDNVTLEQIAVILWNYAGNPVGNGDVTAMGAHSEWAVNALKWAQDKGLLEGVPYDAVTESASRAQTAQILMNYLTE